MGRSQMLQLLSGHICAKTAKIQQATGIHFENMTIYRNDKTAPPLQLDKVSNSKFTGMKLNQDVIKKDCSDVQFESVIK